MSVYHNQVEIEHGDMRAEVDEGIADLILVLWKLGIETVLSCENNGEVGRRYTPQFHHEDRVWIAFAPTGIRPIEYFFDILKDGGYEVEGLEVERSWVLRYSITVFEEEIFIELHVEFPVDQLEDVMRCLQAEYDERHRTRTLPKPPGPYFTRSGQ